MFDVYIAHDPADEPAARSLCDALRERRCRVSAAALLQPGDFVDQLTEAQRYSRLTVVMIGAGEHDHYTLDAVARAIDQLREGRHVVVPLILEAAAGRSLPYGLRRLVPMTLDESGLDGAAQALAEKLNVCPPPPDAPDGSLRPAPGRRGPLTLALIVSIILGVAAVVWKIADPAETLDTSAEASAVKDDVAVKEHPPTPPADAMVISGQAEGAAASSPPRPETKALRPKQPASTPDVGPATPPEPASGIGTCSPDGRCTLAKAGALLAEARVCLSAPAVAQRPTCIVETPGTSATCVRRDRFHRVALVEIGWTHCPD